MPDLPGKLGTYEVTRRLGAGGMGEVFLARDPRLEREVALKVLPASFRADPERRQRFLREARAAAKLAHPNITAIHEIGEADGRDFLAFEYVEGTTLEEHVRGRPLPLRELVDLALPLADALAYAHERGVVHRDLKPANVMVSPRGHPKLLDFGLAKVMQVGEHEGKSETTTLTREGAIFGTPQAMSPEQALGRPVDERGDVFSFGSLIYAMAAGRPAFVGDTAMEILDAVIHAEPVPLSSLRADLPAEFVAIVAKALRKDPRERYQHVADLAADLRHFQRTTESGLVGPGSRRGSPVLWIATAVAVVLALAFVLYRNPRGGSGATPSPARSGDLATAPVGVLGFENLGDRADPLHLNRMLMGLVTTNLAESGGLDVVSTPKILAALREAGQEQGGFDTALAGRAAEIAGVRSMLVGQVAPRGEGLFLSAELVDVGAGRTLGSWTREVGSQAELFRLASSLGDGVRETLGRSTARPGGSLDLASALTTSAEAYRQFVAGELDLHEYRFEDASRRFEKALQLDPTFALASFRLGMSQDWLGEDEDGLEAFRAGLPNVARLPPRWQAIYRAVMARGLEDYDAAYKELTSLGDSAVDLADFNNALGELYTHGTRYLDPRRSRQCFERTLAADPSFRVVLFHLVEDYLVANDPAAAERLVAHYRKLDPADPNAAAAEATLCLARGDTARALAIVEGAGTEKSLMSAIAAHAYMLAGSAERAEAITEAALADSKGYMNGEAFQERAIVRAYRGRFAALRLDLENGSAQFQGKRFSVVTSATLGMIAWTIGSPDAAVAVLRPAVAQDPHAPIATFWLGFTLSETGRLDEARALLADYERRSAGSVSPLPRFWRPSLAGVLLQARGDLEGARRELAAADAEPVEYQDRGLAALLRARLETAAKNPEAAIAAWRELIDPPYLRYSSFGTRNVPWRPFEIIGLYELACLEETRGELDAAREHLRRFLGHWGEADMPLPSIADAKARLSRIEGR